MSISQTVFSSIAETIDTWVTINGCQPEPVTNRLPNHTLDGMSVTRQEYTGGRDGAEVVLYLIDGAGHTWPGQETRMAMLGKSTLAISANDLMWEFFQKHALKG